MLTADRPNNDRLVLTLASILPLSVFFLYWKTLKYPFIQDDWCIMYTIVQKGSVGFLADAVAGNIQHGFYRPVGQAFIDVLYQLFGLNPLGYRIAILLLLSANGLLVAYLIERFSRDKFLAWATALLYVFALSVHIDAVLWIVGIYDLLAAAFFFSSLAFFENKRFVLSSFAYAAGLLTKESTIALPALLLLASFIKSRPDSKAGHIPSAMKASLRDVMPHAIIGIVYLTVRFYFGHSELIGGGGNPLTAWSSDRRILSRPWGSIFFGRWKASFLSFHPHPA